MNRITMFAAKDGSWTLENSSEFLAVLGDPNPDYDAAAFAVKNLGFVKFEMLDDSIIEIELHPHTVELAALLAVQQQILASRVRLFRIRYFDTAWRSEITPSAEGAVSRLSELCTPAFAPPPSQRFVVEPRDYSVLLTDEANPLRLMAQKWRMSFGHFSPSVISFAIEHRLLSRLMIFGVKPIAMIPCSALLAMVFVGLSAIINSTESAKASETNRIGITAVGLRIFIRVSRAPADPGMIM
jgi:hypothetical protein